jgi:acid phosphatase type 7
LNPRAETLRFAVFNDLHHQDKTLAALMHVVQPEDYEFSVLLGDCLEAYPDEAKLFRAWRAYLELLHAAEKPLVFVRGNHDTRQSFANRLAYLVDLPNLNVAQPWGEDQWPFTLRAGPVWFLAMDTGEDEDGVNTDPRTAYKHPEFWRDCRRRQAEWLRKLNATKPGTDAPWHIFLSHIPLYNNNQDYTHTGQAYWEPLLRDTRLDLMLAAHDHGWKLLPQKADGRPPWPVLIGGGPSLKEGTVMLVTADPTKLHARLLAASDGRELTELKLGKAPPAQQ